MINKHFTLTPITDTAGLEDGIYQLAWPSGKISSDSFGIVNGKIRDEEYIKHHFLYYLRPAPEGSVLVDIDELKAMILKAAKGGKDYGVGEMKEWGGGPENELPGPHEITDSIIQTKLAQMGE